MGPDISCIRIKTLKRNNGKSDDRELCNLNMCSFRTVAAVAQESSGNEYPMATSVKRITNSELVPLEHRSYSFVRPFYFSCVNKRGLQQQNLRGLLARDNKILITRSITQFLQFGSQTSFSWIQELPSVALQLYFVCVLLWLVDFALMVFVVITIDRMNVSNPHVNLCIIPELLKSCRLVTKCDP